MVEQMSTQMNSQNVLIGDQRERIDDLEKIVDDLQGTAQVYQRRHDEALRRAEAAEAVARMNAGKVRSMFAMIFKLELRVAHLGGYIARVEYDGHATTPIKEFGPDDLGSVGYARDALMEARGEGQRDRIIESMDTDTLDAVLGRTGDEQSDILR